MKIWTVVIQIDDKGNSPGYPPNGYFKQHEIEKEIREALSYQMPQEISFRIMETIEAPYGPQHPGGVFIKEKSNSILTHGDSSECPDVQSGEWRYCQGHKS